LIRYSPAKKGEGEEKGKVGTKKTGTREGGGGKKGQGKTPADTQTEKRGKAWSVISSD